MASSIFQHSLHWRDRIKFSHGKYPEKSSRVLYSYRSLAAAINSILSNFLCKNPTEQENPLTNSHRTSTINNRPNHPSRQRKPTDSSCCSIKCVCRRTETCLRHRVRVMLTAVRQVNGAQNGWSDRWEKYNVSRRRGRVQKNHANTIPLSPGGILRITAMKSLRMK